MYMYVVLYTLFCIIPNKKTTYMYTCIYMYHMWYMYMYMYNVRTYMYYMYMYVGTVY